MSLQISIELDEHDLARFAAVARQVKSRVPQKVNHEKMAKEVREKLRRAQDADDLPDFIAVRIQQLEQLADMLADTEWGLDAEEATRIHSALYYFREPVDVIPDRVPVLGYLDDAIMIELTLRDFEPELSAYHSFCGFRTAERQRREQQGLPTDISKEDWLADQRALLHHRIRDRRQATEESPGGWKITLW